MTFARWIIGATAGTVAALWFALFVFGDNFRRSFGASPSAPWKLFVPLAVAALLTASAVWPAQRSLLHVTLVVVLLLAVLCLWIMREAPFVATFGLAYGALWVWYYWTSLKALSSGAQH
jgi:hypothetical protein